MKSPRKIDKTESLYFGKALKKKLDEKQLSYRDMEKYTGINHRSFGRYINQGTDPSLSTALTIARFFGMELKEFIAYGANNAKSE